MVSARQHLVNNARMAEDQIVMLQILQKQMEETRQKGIEDRQKNEEEARLLKEQNEELKWQVAKSEHREQSRSNESTQS